MDKQPLNPDIIEHDAHASPVPQEAPDRETDPGPGVADRAHGDLAADAAAHLERSRYTLQSLGGDPEAIERQAACLILWARAKGLVLAEEYTAHLFSHVPITAGNTKRMRSPFWTPVPTISFCHPKEWSQLIWWSASSPRFRQQLSLFTPSDRPLAWLTPALFSLQPSAFSLSLQPPILTYESDGYAVSPSFLRQVDVHIQQVLEHAAKARG
jgi:hypothetical protein